MANTTAKQEDTGKAAFDTIADLQKAGMGNLMGIGTAWIEAMGAMSAEMAEFVADRIKEDVKTQHEILHCKDVADLQRIQAQFMQKAIDQYQAETGKLVEMGTKAFVPPDTSA
ncbi:MAG: phasin family protein [Pseudomonadota bacterium]